MARNENPPFARGATFYDGGTIDSNNLGGVQMEGQVYVHEDIDLTQSGGAKPTRTGRPVRTMIVRNVSGIALLPGRIAKFQKSGVNFCGRVDGYTTTTAEDFAGVVDDMLPAAGVPNNDLFHLVIEGPCLVLSSLSGDSTNVLNVGDRLVGITAATSQSTTAGRIAPQDLTGATALLGNQVQNQIGRALSAKTTANTNANVLVDIRRL